MKKGFPISEKIYSQLLRAYPPSHREQYAAAMMQLFRDQCRDAWAEAGNFGLLKLWLRALQDLAGSSIMERLTALKEKKTMNDKLTNLSVFPSYLPGKVFAKVFVPVFLIVVSVITIATFLLPETYVGQSQVMVQNANFDSRKSSQDYGSVRDELQIIQSPAVLNPVIERLKLNEVWGKKYFAGNSPESAEIYALLKNRITVSPIDAPIYHRLAHPIFSENRAPIFPVFDKKIFRIKCYSEDKIEAAQIANAIAISYQDFLKPKPTGTIEAQFQPGPVQIIDTAEPPKYPVRPNKPLNITLGFFGGILIASIIGVLAALIAKAVAKRKAAVAPAAI